MSAAIVKFDLAPAKITYPFHYEVAKWVLPCDILGSGINPLQPKSGYKTMNRHFRPHQLSKK